MKEFYTKHKETLSKMVDSGSDCLVEKDEGPICLGLMKSIGVMGVYYADTDNEIIAIESHGFYTHNKGYAFSKDREPYPIYESLDKRPSNLGAYSKGYKKLENGWYIFYEYLN